MIDDPNVHQRQRIAQAPGNKFIRLTRLGDAGRMVVREYQRRRAPLERAFHHLARIHARAIDRAAEQLLKPEQAVPVVEEETTYLKLPDGAGHGRTRDRLKLGISA